MTKISRTVKLTFTACALAVVLSAAVATPAEAYDGYGRGGYGGVRIGIGLGGYYGPGWGYPPGWGYAYPGYYAPPVAYVPPPTVVYETPAPVTYGSPPAYGAPPPGQSSVAAPQTAGEQAPPTYVNQQGQTCRQYQTAPNAPYTTSCQQADGSWAVVR